MIPKSNKISVDVKLYRSISLLPSLLSYRKVLLQELIPVIIEKRLIPNYQFGFRSKYATSNRIMNEITLIFETRKYCSAVFLDVSQACDKVWHDSLLYKIQHLPEKCHAILKRHPSERHFFKKKNVMRRRKSKTRNAGKDP